MMARGDADDDDGREDGKGVKRRKRETRREEKSWERVLFLPSRA